MSVGMRKYFSYIAMLLVKFSCLKISDMGVCIELNDYFDGSYGSYIYCEFTEKITIHCLYVH